MTVPCARYIPRFFTPNAQFSCLGPKGLKSSNNNAVSSIPSMRKKAVAQSGNASPSSLVSGHFCNLQQIKAIHVALVRERVSLPSHNFAKIFGNSPKKSAGRTQFSALRYPLPCRHNYSGLCVKEPFHARKPFGKGKWNARREFVITF